jgi:hypothetical protein
MTDAFTPTAHDAAQASPDEVAEAQQLLQAAGAPALAQHVVASTDPAATESSARDDFARRWGFPSYLEMFEASQRAAQGRETEGGWLITHTGGDQWIVWNEKELAVRDTFATLNEAQRSFAESTATAEPSAQPPTG